MAFELSPAQQAIVRMVRDFVEKEVVPVAGELEARDEYPADIVKKMKDLGFFGLTIPEEYGGLGLNYLTYAHIVMEISRGWMSLSGLLSAHQMPAYMVCTFGTEAQRQRFLPDMATGKRQGAFALTEAESGGSDLQAITTFAVRDGEAYIVNGSKIFISNGSISDTVSILVKTDRNAKPLHKGMSVMLVEKGSEGFTAGRDIHKLGYRGVPSAELVFHNVRVPAFNLIGEKEGEGWAQVMSAVEVGRISVAARGTGVSTAAFETAIQYAQQRRTFGQPIAEHQAVQLRLAEMATKIEAARLLTLAAAEKKDAGGRSDLEAGFAKLFASETCREVTMDAMRTLGGYGYTTEFPIERYYRDAPLTIVGEGTNDMMRLIIARALLRKYRLNR